MFNGLLCHHPHCLVLPVLNQSRTKYTLSNRQDEPLQNASASFHDHHLLRGPEGLRHLKHNPWHHPLIDKLLLTHLTWPILNLNNLNKVYYLGECTHNGVVLVTKEVGLGWYKRPLRASVAAKPFVDELTNGRLNCAPVMFFRPSSIWR